MNTEISVTVRRAVIETNLEACRNRTAESYVEMGRWLLAAKEENIVPHGEWEKWVAQHAAMSVRGAQRCMQIAREIPQGSPLAALGMAKLRALMELPTGEREEFAEQIGAQKLSSREVDEAVKAARAERDEALRVVGEQKKRISEMSREASELASRVRRQTEGENAREMRRLESLAKSAELGRKQTEVLLDEARSQVESLRTALEVERRSARIPDPRQERKIRELQEALDRKEQEIDRLSEELDAAQTAAMRGGMSGAGEKPSPATTILSAIGALMAQAGRAPAELARMQGLDPEDRQIISGQARLVGQWAMQVLAACGEGDADA